MLRYELKELTGKLAVYYYPEWFSDCPGIVGLDLETGERLKIEASEKDPHFSYGAKMWRRIEEFAASSDFRKSGIVAWC